MSDRLQIPEHIIKVVEKLYEKYISEAYAALGESNPDNSETAKAIEIITMSFADKLRAINKAEVDRKREQERLDVEEFLKTYVLPEPISEKLKKAAINSNECLLRFDRFESQLDGTMSKFIKWAEIQGLEISYNTPPAVIQANNALFIKVSW